MTNPASSTNKALSLLLIAAILIPFIIAVYIVCYQTLHEGSTDFLPRWAGAYVYFEEGISPYDKRVGEISQNAIHGRLAEEGEDQVLFAYPFYMIFHVGPLVLVEYRVAAAIYQVILVLCMLGSLGLTLNLLGWLPSPVNLALLIIWTITSYFAVRGVLLAQPALEAYFLHMLALWGIYRKQDGLAGMALALATIKPQTGYLIVPLLLIWAWRFHHRKLVWYFAGAFGLMMLLSFLMLPSWFGDWMDQVFAYEDYTATYPVAHIVAHSLPGIPESIENGAYVLLSIALVLPILYLWKKTWDGGQESQFLWLYFLTMLVSQMIAPRVATTYYVELYPVLYITVLILSRRRQQLLILMGWLAMLIGYWLLHLLTVPDAQEYGQGLESPFVYVVFPLMILGLLWYYRAKWWQLDTPPISY
jgi:hypothetical protein